MSIFLLSPAGYLSEDFSMFNECAGFFVVKIVAIFQE
jgi:hypothetical protein